MRTLTLNDGTVLEDSYAMADGNTLWVYIGAAYDMVQAFHSLYYPAKTESMTCNQYGAETVFEGYTHLFCISEEPGGRISAGLKKGE